MGWDFIAYSDDRTPILRTELIAVAKGARWSTIVLRPTKRAYEFVQVVDAIQENDLFCGWDSDADDGIEAGIASVIGNGRAFHRWLEKNRIGTFQLDAICEVGPMDDDEQANYEELGEPFRLLRDRCKIEYYSRSAMGGDPFSKAFTDTMMRGLASIRGGVIVDPQEGTYEVIARGEFPSQRMEPPPKPKWWQFWK